MNRLYHFCHCCSARPTSRSSQVRARRAVLRQPNAQSGTFRITRTEAMRHSKVVLVFSAGEGWSMPFCRGRRCSYVWTSCVSLCSRKVDLRSKHSSLGLTRYTCAVPHRAPKPRAVAPIDSCSNRCDGGAAVPFSSSPVRKRVTWFGKVRPTRTATIPRPSRSQASYGGILVIWPKASRCSTGHWPCALFFSRSSVLDETCQLQQTAVRFRRAC